MNRLAEMLKETNDVVILGHVNPDGDCIGSCLGLYNYLADVYPQINKTIYLDAPSGKFAYLRYFEDIKTEAEDGKTYDLCICLDSSDKERLGKFQCYLETAGKSICIDHHITHKQYTKELVLEAEASSACEVLFGLLEEEKISKEAAECLYTGIIHDTGVFKHSNTTGKTMTIAGKLMDKGIDFSSIIDGSFYRKTYIQNQILGRALLESITFFHGKCIFSAVRAKDMEFYGVTSKDLDGIVDQLRVTEGVECAIFMYQTGPQEYKVSMRSNSSSLDVSKIASFFGGGGHVKAAGCTISGNIHDVVNNLSKHLAKQIG